MFLFSGSLTGTEMEQALCFNVVFYSRPPSSSLHSLLASVTPAVPRMPPRNIQVYNPTPNSLNVRWEPASGQVQQYRVAYSSLTGDRRPESVSPRRPVTRKLFMSDRIGLKAGT